MSGPFKHYSSAFLNSVNILSSGASHIHDPYSSGLSNMIISSHAFAFVISSCLNYIISFELPTLFDFLIALMFEPAPATASAKEH